MVAISYLVTFATMAGSLASTMAAPSRIPSQDVEEAYEDLIVRGHPGLYDELVARGLEVARFDNDEEDDVLSRRGLFSKKKSPADKKLEEETKPVKKLSIQQCQGCPSDPKAHDRVLKEVEKVWKSTFQKSGYNNVKIIMGDGGVAQLFFENTRNGARAGGAARVA
ncbi:hypothetical protein V5O48_016763 [Marasmius crinis-equi]|uniref:Uncharacterized protein n=1 Tax=Marasmius crinis-equi TaxID=585013 RepID=A0ABR3ER01_9AGAR